MMMMMIEFYRYHYYYYYYCDFNFYALRYEVQRAKTEIKTQKRGMAGCPTQHWLVYQHRVLLLLLLLLLLL